MREHNKPGSRRWSWSWARTIFSFACLASAVLQYYYLHLSVRLEISNNDDEALNYHGHPVFLEPTTTKTTTRDDPSSCTDVCSCLKQYALAAVGGGKDELWLTTPSIWNAQATSIINATLRPEEAPGGEFDVYKDWVDWLWTTMSTYRLRKSIHSPPSKNIQAVFDILNRKLQDDPSSPRTAGGTGTAASAAPPLQVVVLGGSLTAGHGCLDTPLLPPPVLLPPRNNIIKPHHACAWPNRLAELLNTLTSSTTGEQPLINVVNMAMAATTSDVGATVVDYDLWPDNNNNNNYTSTSTSRGPDVIIAAFSLNDALAEDPPTKIYDNMQTLMRSVHKSRNCTTQLPLLIFFDDFIGWPGSVQANLDFHSHLVQLAEWYGIMSISYADAVRDILYADWKDHTFKGLWSNNKPNGKISLDAHPGTAFHITAAWLWAYNLLHVGVDYCSAGYDFSEPAVVQHAKAKYRLPTIPQGPLPLLNEKTDTLQLSKEWHQSALEETRACQQEQEQQQQHLLLTGGNSSSIASASAALALALLPKCDFLWIANRITGVARTKEQIEKTMKSVLVNNNGWKGDGASYRNKQGWVAQKTNASFSIRLKDVDTNIRYITILSMKSYGKEWEGARLRMTTPTTAAAQNFEWEGFHKSETSVIVPHKFDLGVDGTILKGSTADFSFDLIGGGTFKITGMTFCSR